MTRRIRSLQRNKRGVSPAFSTMILTAGIIVMVLVTMTYGTDLLNRKMAGNEFSSNQQFMQTAAKHIDHVAWTIGRTQTISYQCRFGQVSFEPDVLRYTVEVYHAATGTWITLPLTMNTGVLLYNMPLSSYAYSNDYFQRLPNNANSSFLQVGSTAPVTHVFAIQKVPMAAGDYLRVAVVPIVRELDSASASGSKLYLPALTESAHPYKTQSVTLTGNGITKAVESGITKIRVNVTFPKVDLGFDEDFFNFRSLSETRSLAQSSLVELYVGQVRVTIGKA